MSHYDLTFMIYKYKRKTEDKCSAEKGQSYITSIIQHKAQIEGEIKIKHIWYIKYNLK